LDISRSIKDILRHALRQGYREAAGRARWRPIWIEPLPITPQRNILTVSNPLAKPHTSF
jgi:hypothetical protein